MDWYHWIAARRHEEQKGKHPAWRPGGSAHAQWTAMQAYIVGFLQDFLQTVCNSTTLLVARYRFLQREMQEAHLSQANSVKQILQQRQSVFTELPL